LTLDPQFMSNNMRCGNRQTMVTAIEEITMREPVEY
jgi:CoA:oxalate CoA-transferase